MSKTACRHRVCPEDGCRVCELEGALGRAREAFEKIGCLSGQRDRHIDDYGEIARDWLAKHPSAPAEKAG